jgi:SAM-dependent methyltransferase
VGIGSGRASVPLLDTGISLTGIDSSKAMLDECRRRAEGRPIQLKVGDVTAIPYPDAAFDCLVSLNVMTHFPNWREVLTEWLRVLRPGGRLVFDIYSLDHVEAVIAQRGPGLEHLLPGNAEMNPAAFNMRVRVAELAEFALAQGITLAGIHPYCGTLGGDSNYWMREGWANGRIWDRMKSWIAEDEKLFEFLVFLEEQGYARLNSKASGRFMAVFEKSPDSGDTARVLTHQTAIDVALSGPVRLSDLSPFLGMPLEDWRCCFNNHLDHPPNRLALFQLLTAGLISGMEPDLADWLEPRHLPVFDRWLLAFQLDRQIYHLASTWYRPQPYADLLEYKGVPLGPGLEYESVQALMRAAISNNATESGNSDHV